MGNVLLETKKEDIVKFFSKYGKIDKLWIRSLPIDPESKLPIKAAAILRKFKEDKNLTKTCYVLFENKESAEKSLESNG